MAYYSCGNYEANSGQYYQTPYYDASHDYVSSQSLENHPSYAYNDYNSFQYDSAPWYGAYEPEFGHPNVAYSSYTFSEPNYVEYALNPYGNDYGTVKTRFIVSYSVSEFNEPEFEEYDPTPYGGGYDPVATYGKPLPPSEGICYPRSSEGPNNQSFNNFSYGSIESPYGKRVDEPVGKPSNGSKAAAVEDREQQTKGHTENVNAGSNGKPIERFETNRGEESKDEHPDHDTNGSEYEKRVSQIPPGYGLEAMDLCESLFGYWPCLARAKRESEYHQNCYHSHGACSTWSDENRLWETTADYLFGNSYPYGERWSNGGIYENPIFNYERHYQGQLVSRQVEYQEEHSWLN
ncbi:hypothetical protein HRI_000946400 [Hibiscus trionum]|uniref:Uncharacterized protein n=1 Tax=Hibiscus trionum TaxID=183268 RepID=A0A9W7LQY8_HIBTR|nr:hypothetical protein HRI_000946400 [Hibiscus trionum]